MASVLSWAGTTFFAFSRAASSLQTAVVMMLCGLSPAVFSYTYPSTNPGSVLSRLCTARLISRNAAFDASGTMNASITTCCIRRRCLGHSKNLPDHAGKHDARAAHHAAIARTGDRSRRRRRQPLESSGLGGAGSVFEICFGRPGQSAVTVTPLPRSSRATPFVNDHTNAGDAWYAASRRPAG